MKLETYNNKKTTANETIRKQQDEIVLLKARIAEQDKVIADMMKVDEQEQETRHPASIRTSFNLPSDWSDLEKLWLAFKVIDADHSLQRQDTFDERDEIFSNLWHALLQAIIIAPTRSQEDIMIKLEAMDYTLTAHLKDHEGRLRFDSVNWLELEAHAINKQLTTVLSKMLLPEQKALNDWREDRNKTFADNVKTLTPEQIQQLNDSVEGKGTLRVEDLYNKQQ